MCNHEFACSTLTALDRCDACLALCLGSALELRRASADRSDSLLARAKCQSRINLMLARGLSCFSRYLAVVIGRVRLGGLLRPVQSTLKFTERDFVLGQSCTRRIECEGKALGLGKRSSRHLT